MASDARQVASQEARTVKYEDSSSSMSDTSDCHENESHADESQTDTDGSGQYELRVVDGRLQAVGFTKYHRKQTYSKNSKPILKKVKKIEDKCQTASVAKSPSFWKDFKDCFF